MTRSVIRACATLTAVTLLLFAASGCTRLRETYYVGVVDDHDHLQFYRFDLTGDAWLSNTKFASGWYSADALEAISGEHIATLLPKSVNAADVASSGLAANVEHYYITGPEGRTKPSEDQRLTIIMSSDVQAITSAIGEVAKSKEFEALLAAQARKASRAQRNLPALRTALQTMTDKQQDPGTKATLELLLKLLEQPASDGQASNK